MKFIKKEETHLLPEDLVKPLQELFSHCLANLAKCYGWNATTQEEYSRIIERIAGEIATAGGMRAFGSLEFADYEDAINAITAEYTANKKRSPTPGTIQKKRMIIAQLCHFVESADIGYYDVTWGSYWRAVERPVKLSSSNTTRDEVVDHLLRLPRSLPIRVEAAFAKVMHDHRLDDSGIYIGGLMMLFLGLRNGECCGVTYGDIQPLYQGCNIQVVYITEQPDVQGDLIDELKTDNSPRVLPVPSTLAGMLEERKQHIMRKWGITAEEIGDYPVVNDGKDHRKPCLRNAYAKGITKVLRQCRIDEDIVSNADDELRGLTKSKERDPTAYVLRRNFATITASVCGLCGDDLDYLMGHRLSSGRDRNEYVNEDKLAALWGKMEKRHLLDLIPNTTVALGSTPIKSKGVTSKTIYTAGRTTIDIYSQYSMDPVRVSVRKRTNYAVIGVSGTAPSMRASYRPVDNNTVERLDIARAYQRTMQRALSK